MAQRIEEKLEFATDLIRKTSAASHTPIQIVENALVIMEFGQLTPKQMLDYIEAVGAE